MMACTEWGTKTRVVITKEYESDALALARKVVASWRGDNSFHESEFVVHDYDLTKLQYGVFRLQQDRNPLSRDRLRDLWEEVNTRLCVRNFTYGSHRSPNPVVEAIVNSLVRKKLGVDDAELAFTFRLLHGHGAMSNATRHVGQYYPYAHSDANDEAILLDFEVKTTTTVDGSVQHGRLAFCAAVGVVLYKGLVRCWHIRARAFVAVKTDAPAGSCEKDAGALFAKILDAIGLRPFGVLHTKPIYEALKIEWSFA